MKNINLPPALVRTWLWLAQSSEDKSVVNMAMKNIETTFKSIEIAKIYVTTNS
jgi:hypothetical protein